MAEEVAKIRPVEPQERFSPPLADFAHEVRQPLSTLEALTSYLDLIIPEEETRVREQLRRMHVEIDHADRILRDGMRTLGAYLSVSVSELG
jgi:signal transduction histidine kinase